MEAEAQAGLKLKLEDEDSSTATCVHQSASVPPATTGGGNVVHRLAPVPPPAVCSPEYAEYVALLPALLPTLLCALGHWARGTAKVAQHSALGKNNLSTYCTGLCGTQRPAPLSGGDGENTASITNYTNTYNQLHTAIVGITPHTPPACPTATGRWPLATPATDPPPPNQVTFQTTSHPIVMCRAIRG